MPSDFSMPSLFSSHADEKRTKKRRGKIIVPSLPPLKKSRYNDDVSLQDLESEIADAEGKLNHYGGSSSSSSSRKNVSEDAYEAMEECMSALKISNDSEVVGREKERDYIKEFIDTALNASNKTSPNKTQKNVKKVLYVSGMPGMGKTLTCKRTCDEIGNKKNNNCAYVYRNCITCCEGAASVQKVMTILIKDLRKVIGGRTPKAEQEQDTSQLIDTKFKVLGELMKKVQKPVLLLLDEVDLFDKGGGTANSHLAKLFSLPGAASKIILIGVANSVGLVQKHQHTFASMKNVDVLTFQPYTSTQLADIVRSRLAEKDMTSGNIFGTMALEFITQQVAKQSGDCRKAFDICVNSVKEALKKHDNDENSNKISVDASTANTIIHRQLNGVGRIDDMVQGLPASQQAVLVAFCVKVPVNKNERRQSIVPALGKKENKKQDEPAKRYLGVEEVVSKMKWLKERYELKVPANVNVISLQKLLDELDETPLLRRKVKNKVILRELAQPAFEVLTAIALNSKEQAGFPVDKIINDKTMALVS